MRYVRRVRPFTTMPRDPRSRLIALLMRLAPDLAEKVWTVRDVRDLSDDVKGAIVDVLGHEAAERDLCRDGSVNDYGCQLDDLAEALELGD